MGHVNGNVSSMSVDSVEPEERRETEAGEYVGVGASLRRSRVESGRELSEVSTALRIRLPHLSAIENGRFDDLPGQAYALGFVRAYAEYLELDSGWVVDRFREEVDPRDATPDLHFPEPPPVRDWRPRIGVVGGAVALAAVSYGGWYYSRTLDEPPRDMVPEVPADLVREAVPEPPVEALPAPPVAVGAEGSAARAEPAPSPPASDIPETPPETPPTEAMPPEALPPATSLAQLAGAGLADVVEAPPPVPGDVIADTPEPSVDEGDAPEAGEGTVYGGANAGGRVVLRAVRESWISVRGPNGERVFTRLLKPGDSYRVPARGDLSMIVGNAGGLAVEVDGVMLPALGEEGRTRRGVSLDPATLMAALR